MSALLFVPVPGGRRDAATALLRLVVVPRLDAGTVADNGLAAWPPAAFRGPLTVTLTGDADGPTPTTVTVTPRLVDQEGLWDRVFGSATVSPPQARDLAASTDPVTVAATSQQVADVHASYGAVAQAYGEAVARDPRTALAAYAAAVERQVASPVWNRGHPPTPPVLSAPVTRAPVAATDVNRIYGMLREHPRVLAALGLVVELDVPVAALPAGTTGTVRIDWPGAAAVSPALPPVVARTSAFLRDTFLPAPHPVDDQHPVSDLDAGTVRLDDADRWQVGAVDVDSAVNRMTTAAASGPDTATSRGDAVTPGPPTALPALRTAGLMLLHADRAAAFAARRFRAAANAGGDDPTLYAEDLVLGYRVDVQDADRDDAPWTSLGARTATYAIEGTVVSAADSLEEGHVKAHAAHRDETTGQLLADEVVVRWDGWSLAVPRPFPPPTVTDADPGLPYTLTTAFAVPPGSLPPLRFGTSYRLRARVADLAGGGLGVDDPGAAGHPTAPYTFLRHEPVSAPSLRLPDGVDAEELGPAVHVAHLVVTSAGGDPTATGSDPVLPAAAQRDLGRPTVSLTTAEWHGAVVGDAATTWPIARLAVDGILPDPAAIGVAAAVVDEPDAPVADPVRYAWPAWPDTASGTVSLRPREAGSSTPLLTTDGTGIVVTLAPAEDVAVQLSSTVASADVAAFVVAAWTSDTSDTVAPAAAASTTTTVAAGQHPMVTPSTVLRCVHAVRRPLADPAGSLAVTRAAGTRPAVLTPSAALFGLDTASTGQVDVTAAWTEVSDDVRTPAATAPLLTPMTEVPVQSLVIHRGDTGFAAPITHHLPDTRHRTVTYTVTATSRFVDHFDPAPAETFTARPLVCQVEVPSTAAPAPPTVVGVVPAFVWEQTPGPTITRVRRGNRIRVELERPWFDSGAGEQLALVLATPDAAPAGRVTTTQAGRDPLYETPVPARWPSAAALPGAAGRVARVTGSDGVPVDVVPSDVTYDPTVGRWFADFDLTGAAGASYAPLVRPALARYQPHSVAGCELSAVVLADFVPLLPDRTLTVSVAAEPDADTHVVTVVLAGAVADGPWPTMVSAVVEHGSADTDLTTTFLARDTVGWWSVPGSEQRAVLGQPMVFTIGSADLTQYRVRVRELQQTAFGVGNDGAVFPPPVMGTLDELGWGVVFVDTVPLAGVATAP